MLKPIELATILVALQSLTRQRRAGDPIPEISNFAALNSETLLAEDETEALLQRLNAQATAATDILWLSVPRPYAELLPGLLTAMGDRAGAVRLIEQIEAYRPGSSRELYVAHAKEAHAVEGEIEFDDNATISEVDTEIGAYVQAWVWVEADGVTRSRCVDCDEEFNKSEMLPDPCGTTNGLVCTGCMAERQLEVEELRNGEQPHGAIGEDRGPG